jgi:hypothetical protein
MNRYKFFVDVLPDYDSYGRKVKYLLVNITYTLNCVDRLE